MKHFFSHLLRMLRKDLALELRDPRAFFRGLLFALIALSLSSVAFSKSNGHRVSMVIWIVNLFVGTVVVESLWQREESLGAFERLRTLPLSPTAVVAGKTLAAVAMMAAINLIMVPLSLLLFGQELPANGPLYLLMSLLAIFGYVSVMSFFGALVLHAPRARVALTIASFPLASPAMLAAIALSQIILEADVASGYESWLLLLVVFDLAICAIGLALFETVIDH